ncbi:MAG TPA: sigma-70 family RNA polymerase sigma factor [Thermoanaerobaculia bacterium]|jgi:RNA polymerase sigma factor for flagellar operon FliA
MEPEQRFVQNLDLINRIVAFVCRRNHLDPAESDEFSSHVRLKLLEDDYAVLRKFEGRSSLSTYLTTVIQRLFFQYRVQLWGKWRPSAEAKRLGEKAITLERMLTRDDYTLAEAIATLTTGKDPLYTRAEIEALYLRLPSRQPRPVLVPEIAAPDIAAPAAADDGVMQQHRECTARAVSHAIDNAIESMDSQDKVILQMRFWHGSKVPEIAAALHVDQKKLYKRIDHLIGGLRVALEGAGIARDDIGDLLTHADHNLTLHAENRPSRPSHPPDGDLGEGTGRRSG